MPPTSRHRDLDDAIFAPLLLGGTLVRLAPVPEDPIMVRSEVWGPAGWEPADIPVGDILRSGIPPSVDTLREFGVPPEPLPEALRAWWESLDHPRQSR